MLTNIKKVFQNLNPQILFPKHARDIPASISGRILNYDSTSPKVNVISAKNINNSKPSLLLLNLSQLMRSNISVQLPLRKHVIAKL